MPTNRAAKHGRYADRIVGDASYNSTHLPRQSCVLCQRCWMSCWQAFMLLLLRLVMSLPRFGLLNSPGLKKSCANCWQCSNSSSNSTSSGNAMNRRCAFLHISDPKQRYRLFDSLVLPILGYASEIWAVDDEVGNSAEQLHRRFLKHACTWR